MIVAVNEKQLSNWSRGCIDYGNNNFWEACWTGHVWLFVPHDSYIACGFPAWEGYSFDAFMKYVPTEHQDDVLEQFNKINPIPKV